jgi:hypothetical protein
VSREALKSHFLALKNYRNPLGHARDMDIVEQKHGEAAVIWFRRTVDKATGLSGAPDVHGQRQHRFRGPKSYAAVLVLQASGPPMTREGGRSLTSRGRDFGA